MNKNIAKKNWRQLDEALGAMDNLIDEGVIDGDEHDMTFDGLKALRDEVEEKTKIEIK